MNRFLVLIVIISLSVPACFDDDPSGLSKKKNDNGTSPYSGSFIIADTIDVNTCLIPVPPSSVTNVTVIGDSICFGGFPGEWDPLTTTGEGTSPEVTVPVDPPECYAYYTVTFSITYTDTDHFHGTYSAYYRKEPGCPNPDPCSYTYLIGGSRN